MQLIIFFERFSEQPDALSPSPVGFEFEYKYETQKSPEVTGDEKLRASM
jgi:hypothetical protein